MIPPTARRAGNRFGMLTDEPIARAGREGDSDLRLRLDDAARLEVRPRERVGREDVLAVGTFGQPNRLVETAAVLGEKPCESRRVRHVGLPRRFGEAVLTLGVVASAESREQVAGKRERCGRRCLGEQARHDLERPRVVAFGRGHACEPLDCERVIREHVVGVRELAARVCQLAELQVEMAELRVVPGERFGILRARRFGRHLHRPQRSAQVALQLARVPRARVRRGVGRRPAMRSNASNACGYSPSSTCASPITPYTHASSVRIVRQRLASVRASRKRCCDA